MHVNHFHTEATDQFLKVTKSEFSDDIGLLQKEKNDLLCNLARIKIQNTHVVLNQGHNIARKA
jgi:hypothetical protein